MKSAILLLTTLLVVIVANAVGIVTAAEPARQPRVPAGRMKAAVTEITSTRDPASAPTSDLSDGIASPAPGAAWYTAVAGGDYFEDGGTPPVFHLDLGADHDMGGIAFTNYATNDNRVSAFAMQYATEAETTSHFGASIPDAIFALSRTKTDLVGVKHKIAPGESQSISFSCPIKARYVELTLTDNSGGNRVGFDDIEFISEVPPPPWKPRRAEFVLEPEVIMPSTKEWRYWGGPTLVELRSGRLLLSLVGTNENPAPRIFVSDDRGKTFFEIDSFPHRMQHPVGPSTLLRLADERIALVMHRVYPTGDGGGLPGISFTSDEGKTWSKPQIVGSPEDEGAWYTMNDRMLQARSGRLIIPVAAGGGKHEGDNNSGLCFFSDDGGASWEKSTRPARLPGAHGMAEPCIVERNDGSLLMLARTGEGALYRSLSSDGGLTWSDPERTTLVSALSPLTLRRMPDGRLFVLYDHARPIGNKIFPRRPFVFSLSDDDGETWGPPWIIDDEPDRSFVYGSITFLKEGILSLLGSQLETEAHKKGAFGGNPPDAWKYSGGKRVLIKYPSKS